LLQNKGCLIGNTKTGSTKSRCVGEVNLEEPILKRPAQRSGKRKPRSPGAGKSKPTKRGAVMPLRQ